MLKPNGAAELTVFTEKSYKETITPIVPGIWHVLGVGHSNAVIIEGRTSVILVDTLDTLERGQKLLEIIRRYNNDLYVFSLDKVTKEQGRLSLSYSVPVVKYLDIRSVTVVQDIWGRIFDFGTVELSTAAREGSELFVEGIRDPEGLASFVEDCRTHQRNRQSEELLQQHENSD